MLITVTGVDQPGVTSALFEVLCWNEGRFAFRKDLPQAVRSLSGSLPELLARADAVP